MSAVAIIMLLTPPPPPSGPIWGQLECLFADGSAQEAGSARFAEAGLSFEGILPSTIPESDRPQIRLVQFPIDGRISDVEFEADQAITIHGEAGSRVLGKLTPLKPSSDGRWWMNFSVLGPSGELAVTGKCIADVRGRPERPVRLTKIATMRVN